MKKINCFAAILALLFTIILVGIIFNIVFLAIEKPIVAIIIGIAVVYICFYKLIDKNLL